MRRDPSGLDKGVAFTQKLNTVFSLTNFSQPHSAMSVQTRWCSIRVLPEPNLEFTRIKVLRRVKLPCRDSRAVEAMSRCNRRPGTVLRTAPRAQARLWNSPRRYPVTQRHGLLVDAQELIPLEPKSLFTKLPARARWYNPVRAAGRVCARRKVPA